MKIFSEKTNKYYATVDECLEAEKKHDEAIAVKEAKKKELSDPPCWLNGLSSRRDLQVQQKMHAIEG